MEKTAAPPMRLHVLSASVALAACTSGDAGPAPAASAPEPPAAAAPASPPTAGAAAPGTKGCSLAPRDPGALTRKSLAAAGKARTYQLAVPAGAKTGQALPLLFVLHGAGDSSPENMRTWFGVEGKMPAVLAVYPQALARTRMDGTGGNVARWDLSGNDDLAFFDAMLAQLSDDSCVDRAHVFVTGFSSGGNFSQHLACLRQKDVKGMAVVAGPGPFSDTCGGAVPAWMTHDANDDTLPVADARDSRDFWSGENGCAKGAWSPILGHPECKRNVACSAREPVVYCETTGVGHAVPAFAAAGIGEFFGALLQ